MSRNPGEYEYTSATWLSATRMTAWLIFQMAFMSLVLPTVLFIAETRGEPLRYVAVGDSYTAGTGVEASESWPSQLARRLTASGIETILAANLAHKGWTTVEAIDHQLPRLKNLEPDFVTVLIGVNDWFRDAVSQNFRDRLGVLLDGVQKELSDPKRLLVVTVPDFSCSPTGKTWGYGKSAVNGVNRFNAIIKTETASRNLPVADIFSLSQNLCSLQGSFAPDGVHPSPRQYEQWVELIFPVALDLLKSGKKSSAPNSIKVR